MYPEWSHKYTSVRLCPTAGYGPKAQIKVMAGLHFLQGNQTPHFSVTADIYIPGKSDIEAGGAMHDDILKYWPKLAPVVALHLCGIDGVPMHANANGWYWLAGYYQTNEKYHGGNSTPTRTPDDCLQIFADHVRVSLEDARTLAESWRCDDDWQSSKRWFIQWVNTQLERWDREAKEAIALLDSMIAEQTARKAEKE